MANPILRRLSRLLASCAVSFTGASCSTEEVQLESMHVYAGADDPEVKDWYRGGTDGAVTCLTLMNLVDDAPSYEVRLNGKPLISNPSEPEALTTRSTEMFCIGAGDFNVSLVARGKTVAQTGVTSMRAGSQHVVRIRGDRRAPNVRVEEIDMSSPGPGLYRVRVTNLVSEQKPVELYFYDYRDEGPLASTGLIAYGDTFVSSLPLEVNGFRTALDGDLAGGFLPGTGRSNPLDKWCIEKPPAGVVLLGSSVKQGATTTYHSRQEHYLQRPQTCTVDKSVCQPETCPLQGW